jgi:hypothetical protein
VETAIVLPNIFVCGFQWENNYWAGDDLTPFTVPLGYTKLIFASNSTDGADIEGYETNWGNYVYRGRLVLLKNSTALEDVVNYTGTTNLTRQIFDVVAGDVISLDYRGTSGAAIELACVLSP